MNHLLHLQTQKHESHNLLGGGYDDEFLECILGKKFTPGNARSIKGKIYDLASFLIETGFLNRAVP